MIKFVSDTVQVHITAYFEEFQVYKFLLLKRSENEILYPGIWQVITGTTEGEETALETAIRETKEEIGLNPDRVWTIPYITNFFTPKTNSIHSSPVFGMLVNPDDEIILSEEHDKYEWLHLDLALEKLVLPSHREATKIFHEYILSTKYQHLFEIK
jgi:dATP pyrophosphohydrolase